MNPPIVSGCVLSEQRQLVLLLCAGVVVAAAFYFLAVVHGSGGHAAPPQPDTLLYMQYARAIAEGRPYRFIEGDAPSTGSTSHLYPVLLAVPYALGARGDALLTGGFVLNALFYLAFLWAFWLVARRVMPDLAGWAAAVAVLSGYLSSTVLRQSDIGLFMALSWGALAAVVWRRPALAAAVLVLCPWARPEGAVLAGVLLVVGAWSAARREEGGRALLAAGAAGVASSVLMLAFNRWLTGVWGFHSTLHKDYTALYGFVGTVIAGSRDLLAVVREVLFNISDSARQAYLLPVAGGLLALAGLVAAVRAGREIGRAAAWWILASAASIVLVALSGWQGMNVDRYLGWIVPTWLLLAVAGAGVAGRFLGQAGVTRVLLALLAGYELIGLPFFGSLYASHCAFEQSRAEFLRNIHARMAAEESVGLISGSGAAYEMPGRRVAHVTGITSPAFAGARNTLCALEALKHRPELRFDHWLVTEEQGQQPWMDGLLGEREAADSNALGDATVLALRAARWELMDPAAMEPLDPAVRKRVEDLEQTDRLDVGWLDDEERCGYRWWTRLAGARLAPVTVKGELGGREILEVGQPVVGSDSFRVRVKKGKALVVVLRTGSVASGTMTRMDRALTPGRIEFGEPVRLKPVVNGRLLDEMVVEGTRGVLSEGTFEIPADAVDSEELAVTLGGDHLALAYWFYQ